MLRILKTHRFIGFWGVTVRSKRSTVTMKRPRWTVSENIAIVGSEMEGPDASLEMHYKNALISLLRSRSDGPDAPRAVQSGPL